MLKVKAGDPDKMGLLFERHSRALYGFLFHMSNHREASEDMVQIVFYRMLKYSHSFSGEGEFKTWMYHLARNVLKDQAKKDKRMGNRYDIADFSEKMGNGESADGDLQRKQDLNTLQNALNRLNADHREVLVMSKLQELKYHQIAAVMNITEGAVKVRVHRAINELKEIYAKVNTKQDGDELQKR
jgi:RNA polymerase sigma-70 factor (ECF subfamily)